MVGRGKMVDTCNPRGDHAKSAVLKELKIRICDGGRAQYMFSTLGRAPASRVEKSPLTIGKVSSYRSKLAS